MKQKYFSLLVFLLISMTVLSQKRDRSFIPTSEVPEVIKTRHNALFPSQYIEGWKILGDETNPELYIVHFQESSVKGFSATYTSEGILVFHSQFMPNEILPETPVLSIRRDHDEFDIQSGYRITIPVPEREIYRIDILDENRLRYLYYTVDGTEIPEESLPLEIRLFER